MAIIYRTLKLSNFEDSRFRYKLKEIPENVNPYYYLVYTNCNWVIDYSDSVNKVYSAGKNNEKGLSKKYKFKILNQFFRFTGLYNKWQKEK